MTAFTLILGLLCALLATSYVDAAQAASQCQQGSDITSQTEFNMSPTATTAVVNTNNYNIQLPAYASKVAAMWVGISCCQLLL
jgi:hypothetical protein